MITEENGITINYIGEKTDDYYVAEVKCKEDDNDSNFIELQKICLHLAKYKCYKEDIDRELQVIKHRQIAGVFLLLWQLKQNGIAFVTAYSVLEFPFITYCLGVSRINPLKYNFFGQIRERIKNAVLKDLTVAIKDTELDFLKTCPQIQRIDVWYNDNFSILASIYIFSSPKCRFVDFRKLFNYLKGREINIKKLAEDALSRNQNDIWALCNRLQETFISFENGDIDSFKNIPDSLKYIFANTGGKYLYLEQFTDLYANIFNCSFQSAYKMWKKYHISDKNKAKILWKEYEQQITNPKYYKVSKVLKTMKYSNLRCSCIYTLLYAILIHMCYIEEQNS